MSEPYVGEIRMFGGNFAPLGWEFCHGNIMQINDYEVLFVLIGTTYGGDGVTTFALPDLRGRLPVHHENALSMGMSGGTEMATLTTSQLPAHNHLVSATTANATTPNPTDAIPALAPSNIYGDAEIIRGRPSAIPISGMVQSTGGSLPHNNLMPYLCINFIISLYGIFPSQG